MSELEELRALVREVIRDVLPSGFPGGLPVTETVNLSTDEDLAAFVMRCLTKVRMFSIRHFNMRPASIIGFSRHLEAHPYHLWKNERAAPV